MSKITLLYKHIALYCLSKWGILRPEQTAVRNILRNRAFLGILLALSAPVKAGENVGFNKADLAFTGFVITGFAATSIPEPDKQTHFYVGMAVGGFTTALTKNAYYGIAATGIVAGLKEGWDRNKKNHEASWPDFGYTVAGGTIASGLIHLLQEYDKERRIVQYSYERYNFKQNNYEQNNYIGYSKRF